ncbi:MAG: tetratricopeptide repeat protein [Bacteroidaceae bacterium]|nr:tetratricopeptide repeat protein [Bacteroidaceae bacterium]
MTRYTRYILLLFILATLCGCASRKKNTATTRAYHAFFARYNTYYNGNVAYKKAIKSQISGHKDNYLEQLPLLIVSNDNTQKIGTTDFDKAIEKAQKAIKNHSIKRKPKKPAGKKLSQKQREFYAKKEFNPFLWKAWMMMANSQFQKGEFTEAASTYIYISRLYENQDDIVAQARIGLARCYAEMDWLYETEDLLQRIERDTVPEKFEGEFAQAKGNLLIKQERYDEAIPHVAKGIKRSGITPLEKAREYYLLGQLYAMTGDKKAAYKSFGRTISASPPYELEFNARIRQTEMATDENHKKILRKLKRMARSSKNKDYLSQIYYAIGNIHLSQKDTTEAIKAYETGIAEGKSGDYGTAMLHLSLAKIYWNKEKFSKSYENYSKAMPMINEETPEFEEVKFRSEVLGDLVKYTDIVEKQSELLYWASLSPEELYPIIDELIEEEKRKEELRKKEEKKLERESKGSELDNAGTQAGMTIVDQNEKQQWYFYNPQLVSQGIRTFKQKWGDRSLKDYWRFSHEISSLTAIETETSDSIQSDMLPTDSIAADSIALDNMANIGDEDADTLSTDPTTREFYLQQIPDTDEKKSAAHTALRDALYESGVRFKDNVNDKYLTLKYLERIPNDYPDFERLADTYYQLFLACSRWDEPDKAEYYKGLLIANYPDSASTKLIQEPDFFDNAIVRKHKEDSIYAKAYRHYTEEEYDEVIKENNYSADKYPKGKHRARFAFIDAMSKLYSDRQDEALKALEELISVYPSDSISRMASEISTGIKEGRLLQSGISTSIWERKLDGTIASGRDSIPSFTAERNEPYYFVLAFPNTTVDQKRLLFEMARYNFSRYMVRKFEMTFEELAEITLLEVKEFLNFDEAFIYRKRLYENSETARLLEGMNAIIISKGNLDLLLQYYTFEEYRKFYEENFMAIPEVEIDGYTLDEPDYGNGEESDESGKDTVE